MNLLTSQFSYYGGNQRLVPTGIIIPDPDMDAEDRKQEYHFTFANGDTIPCKDCELEVLVDQWGYEFKKALVTDKFTYFVNWEEGDPNGAYFMFRGNVQDYDLTANNYFASQAFFESLANEDRLFMSKELLEHMKMPEFQEMINEAKE
jgi:hypothetical protein